MEKLYVCYLMNNIIDDVNDTKNNLNLLTYAKLKKERK